jgi:hypothetical protein
VTLTLVDSRGDSVDLVDIFPSYQIRDLEIIMQNLETGGQIRSPVVLRTCAVLNCLKLSECSMTSL